MQKIKKPREPGPLRVARWVLQARLVQSEYQKRGWDELTEAIELKALNWDGERVAGVGWGRGGENL